MRARFVVINAMIAALGFAAWRVGLFASFAMMGPLEIALLALLAGYFAVGWIAAMRGKWRTVAHVANALPAWGLGCTGLGLLIAAAGLHSLTPEALSNVFRALVFAVAPNVVGVIGFAWLAVLAHWVAGEAI